MAQLNPGLNALSINNRDFDVLTPTDYDSNLSYPIVFELHGLGQYKDAMDDQGVVDEQQYISVIPEGTYQILLQGNVWNTWPQTAAATNNADDVAYLTNVYNDVQTRIGNAFDANQVYAYGYSNGGAMAMKMVKETTLFKAITVRAMTLVDGETIASGASHVPMLFIHGTKDATVPYLGGQGQYPLSPDFMDVKEAVGKWATHNSAGPAQDIHYLASGGIGEFWLREYRQNADATPVYLLAVVDAEHNTNSLMGGGTTGFANRNIKRSAIKFFSRPRCYGLYRNGPSCP